MKLIFKIVKNNTVVAKRKTLAAALRLARKLQSKHPSSTFTVMQDWG